MTELKDILRDVEFACLLGSTETGVSTLCFDSRQTVKDSVFIAVRGTQTDGHRFIDNAIEKGASAIICEKIPSDLIRGVTYVQVKDSAAALGRMASNYYSNPSGKLQLIGITGTNGKTTVATLLYELFYDLGSRCGLISTIVNKINESCFETRHTTPDPLMINRLLSGMVQDGCDYCFMEVSSHAIAQKRIAGLTFSGAVFTNITHDHLDYHGTFDDYIKAKKSFFDHLPSEAFAVLNKDDRHFEIMMQNCSASVFTYALKSPADYTCKIVENSIAGLQLKLDGYDVWSKLTGRFNAYNILAIYAVARRLQTGREKALKAISKLPPVEGRFQYVITAQNVTAIVDYAHTPDALKNVLNTIREIKPDKGKLITIVGCGGERDKAKRPLMAQIAAISSDQLILTSDNPRSESPDSIIEDMLAGISAEQRKRTLVVTNRREAIHAACTMARQGDILLVAGKGHEKYQEIKGVKHPFDDMAILKSVFQMQEK